MVQAVQLGAREHVLLDHAGQLDADPDRLRSPRIRRDGVLAPASWDEAFGLVDDRMDQAFRPAMITRPQAQFWIVSTANCSAVMLAFMFDVASAGFPSLSQAPPP
mgnify:CR=1 FL=1